MHGEKEVTGGRTLVENGDYGSNGWGFLVF